jgi:hypothetical protein
MTNWSKDRPKRPDRDPMLKDLRELLRRDNRSTYAKANVSGLAPATIKKIESGDTRTPQSVTIQMMYRMLGYDIRAVPRLRKGR